MKKRAIVLFLLAGLLSGCASATPKPLPTATVPSISNATLAETSVPTPGSTSTSHPATDFNIERVAQLGGSINGIVVVGDLAYVGMGPRVAVIDISRHEHPQLVTQSEPLPGMVTQLILISGGPAPLLLVNAGRYLVLMDGSGPNELKPVHRLELEGAITAMVWDESASMVYTGEAIYHYPESPGYDGSIAAISITPDNNFKFINSVSMPERPLSLALGEGSLFAGAEGYEGGLYYIQVKAPGVLSKPALVIASTEISPLQPRSMQVIGKTLYLSYRAMEAYDITNPNQPVQTWKKVSGSGDVIDGFTFAGEQVCFFGWTIRSEYVRGVMALPLPIVGSPLGGRTSITAMHNGDFLVAYNDLEIYDTAVPQDLQLMGSYQSPVTSARDAVANEKAIFVLDMGVGDGHSNAVLRAFSLPELSPLGQLTTELPNNQYCGNGLGQCMTLEGDRLYLASLDSVWAYDISNMQPTLLGKAKIVDEDVDAITAFMLGEKRLLAVSQKAADHSNALRVYNMTDLQKPTILGSLLPLVPGITLQMAWNEPTLYVLQGISYPHDMLYAIHFENNAPTLRQTLKLEEYTDHMAVDQKLIMLIGSGENARQPEISTVEGESLKLLAQKLLPEGGMGVAINGDKAFVVVGGEYVAADLLMYAVEDPAAPMQIQSTDIPISSIFRVAILMSGPYVVLANGQGGVEVFREGN